ncbi:MULTISPECIES: helix-turn-helix domain-containing protein [unclassified Luteococcus]|uniref:helix-turn-helix domain-containing protein n=1 Tax=unclassified Luteococcus TaxID=2639923 RepID=UPI00313B091A
MTDGLAPNSRGTLFPARLPTGFWRLPASPEVSELVSWWWISQWALTDGEESHQELLAFPASNLVLEDSQVRFWGPTTRRSTKVLRGHGWALGALLRPAAVRGFVPDPASLRDDSMPVDMPALHTAVATHAACDLRDAVGDVEPWLVDRVGPIGDEARLANRMAELANNDPNISSVSELASALGISERSVHRLAASHVGLSPYSIIRRRRLQEAVAAAREDPQEALASIAARFGFVDQAHLAREARKLLGYPLQTYRRELTEHRQ